MDILRSVIDFIPNLFRRFLLKRYRNQFASAMQGGLTDTILELLFVMMRLAFLVNKDYRRNIKGFKARYTFKSRDGKVAASAEFRKNRMYVKRDELDKTDITVIFDNSASLSEFLFSEDPNVFDFILENRLNYKGNLNYMLKFGYMAKHLQLMFGI